MMAKGNNKWQERRDGQCFFCKKPGHIARNCPKKRNQKDDGKQQARGDNFSSKEYPPPLDYQNSQRQRDSHQRKPDHLRILGNEYDGTIMSHDEITARSKDFVDLIKVDVLLDDYQCKAYLDCGATTSTVSTRLAKQLGFDVSPNERRVKYFNGAVDRTKGTVENVTVTILNVVVRINFLVIDSYDFDVILGLNWFLASGASICPSLNSLSFPGLKMFISTNDDDQETDRLMLQDMDSTDEFTGLDSEWTWEANKDYIVKPEQRLNERQLAKFERFARRARQLSASCYAELATCNIRQHEIHMSNTSPFYLTSFRFPESERQLLWRELKELLDNKIIRRSTSPYGSRSFFVGKKGGAKRLVVDYKPLNAYMYQMHSQEFRTFLIECRARGSTPRLI